VYKIISLDLDGTLLDSYGNVSEMNIEVIRMCQSAGALIVVSTGRPPRYTKFSVHKLATPDYVVCYNGAVIYKGEKLVEESFLPTSTGAKIINYLNRFKNMQIAMEINDKVFANFDLSRISPGIIFQFDNFSSKGMRKCSKILVNEMSNKDYISFKEVFDKECNIARTNKGSLVEIMPQGVSKWSALKVILEIEGIDYKDAIAFGDDTNDYEIIKHVGMGVAMENGVAELKKIAKRTAKSNDNNGVAHTLKEIFDFC